MLDAHPASDALARPALPDAAGDTAATPVALFAAARDMLPVLEAGRSLDAAALRDSMTRAFGASDAAGGWIWKDAYEAAETAVVLFLQRYGRAMRQDAGAGTDGPGHMLAMLETIAALEPSHTRRSEEQIRLQQFSTPLPLAYAALQAVAIRPGDTVLEPSAGTGMLAVMAECALGDRARGALHLNEIAGVRAGVLGRLFPGTPVTRHNAETIADRLPDCHPTVVLMNPPFSATPGVARIRHDADLRHLRSAFAMLPPGGRLAAITSAGCVPGDAAWSAAFARFDTSARCVFTMAIDGRAYARRGTGFDTRLTVLDRDAGAAADFDRDATAANAAELLAAVIARVPPRLPLEPVTVPVGTTADLFDRPQGIRPKAPAATPARKRDSRTEPAQGHDWGPVGELAIETAPPATEANGSAAAPVGPYAPWRPGVVRIAGARPHPTPLVQSAAMAAVPHPVPSGRPMLPERIVTDGLLSDAQLESVVLAGEAHSRHLEARYRIGSGWETVHRCDDHGAHIDTSDVDAEGETLSAPVCFRRGWMLGDGTGCGKGRQVAAIILDNRLRGRKRALWLSQSDKLLEDARRDWTALGGLDADVIPLGGFRQGTEIPQAEGILFATYATLRSPSRQGKPSRLDQAVAWLAGSLDEDDRHAFDGVVVFDEAHAMANAAGATGTRGEIKPSQQGRAGLRLQNALPDARVAYVSATGATTVPGLAYAGRLGLWAAGETPFETRAAFVGAMEAGGVAAMEVVARDLKALGVYQARALAYDGVEIDILEHPLSPEQRRIYDAYAGAFKIIHGNIEDALKATGIVDDGDVTLNRNAKAAALAAFESTKQRFFCHLLTGMKCPSLIRAIEADLTAGRSAVIQLVSTGEALMERRIAEIPAVEWDDLNIDLTPRDGILSFLMHAFPVQLQEPFTDEDGKILSQPVFDDDGNPIICREAEARRGALIEKLAALPPVPTALDRILHHFGHEAVAEVTGRTRRVLRIADAHGERLALRSRPASANLAETAAFMDGTKRILAFSMAGGTGRSYHADLSCGNSQRRVHYLLEPGWRADQAIQGLGRTHRTHQASAPLFRPVTTNVKGERRFIATIARRLDSLGAITRGQRDSQTAMGGNAALFRASDNLESVYARAALRQFYSALWRGRIEDWNVERFSDATGLRIVHEGVLKDDLPPMPRFLNRLLALPIDEQNRLFEELEKRIAANVEQAIEAGTYEAGIETVVADSLLIAGRETLYEHPGTGAATELVEIVRLDRVKPTSADAALDIAARHPGPDGRPVLMVNGRSGRGATVLPAPSRVGDDGGVQERVRLLRPATRETMARAELDASSWKPADETPWRAHWDAEIAELPSHRDSRFWLARGLLLPVWDRLPAENMRVSRLATDDGEALIGRVLDAAQVGVVRAAFGLDGGPAMTGREAFKTVLWRGTALSLANGWRLARRRIMNADRVEIEGPADTDVPTLRGMGCTVEIVAWRTRMFVPGAPVAERILERWPLAA